LGVSKNEVAASCSWETWARRAKAGVGRCRAKVLPPRIRGTTNLREILSALSFFFLPDDCAELVRSTPNGKNRAGWIKFRPGLSGLGLFDERTQCVALLMAKCRHIPLLHCLSILKEEEEEEDDDLIS